MRGCEAGELELVGDRLCLGLGLGVGWERCRELRIWVTMRHNVCVGSVRVHAVCAWSAWGQMALYATRASERVNTLVRGGHCERGWGGGDGEAVRSRAKGMGIPWRLATWASKGSPLQSEPGRTMWKGTRYYRLGGHPFQRPRLALCLVGHLAIH